jgi:hypothetical protein
VWQQVLHQQAEVNPFPSRANYRADEPLELVHGDLCGPIKLATPDGKTMFFVLVDNQSRYMWITLLKSNSDALAMIKQVQAEAEAECSKKLRVLHTDRGGEFTSASFQDCCDDKLNVQRHLTAPYSPSRMGWWSARIRVSLGR